MSISTASSNATLFSFIGKLASLDDTESRRVAARLRQAAAAANDLSDFAGRTMEFVYRFASPDAFSEPGYRLVRQEEAFALAALSFVLHKQKYRDRKHPPGKSKKINFGHSLRRLKDRLGDKGGPSLDLRFNALLDSPFEDLFYHLPHLVQRVASHEADIPINHAWLLQDLLHWERHDRNVQRNWSRAFWKHHSANTDPETDGN